MIDPDFAADEIARYSNHAHGYVKLSMPALPDRGDDMDDVREDMDGVVAELSQRLGQSYTQTWEELYALAGGMRDDQSLCAAVRKRWELAAQGAAVELSDGRLADDSYIVLASQGDWPDGSERVAREVERLSDKAAAAFGTGYPIKQVGKAHPGKPREVGSGDRARKPDEEDLHPEVKRLRDRVEQCVRTGKWHTNAIGENKPHGAVNSYGPKPYRSPGPEGPPQFSGHHDDCTDPDCYYR